MALRNLLLRRLRRSRSPFVPGNRVEVLLDGGPFFRSLIESIQKAERYVYLESYIVRADEIGWRVAHALAERAQAGVEVALSVDGYGSVGLDAEYLSYLRDAGVKLLVFRSVSFSKRVWPWSQRNHRKVLIADGRVGIVGGMNISSDYAAVEDGGAGWRDTAVRVEGPAVFELDHMFRTLWNREKGAELRELPLVGARFGDGDQVRFLGNFARRDRSFIRRSYLLAIVSAEKTIRICNAYFIPDRVIRRALVRAARRGVTVEIIVAGATDVPAALYATRSMYSKLLKAGVHIYEWSAVILHAKTAVIDGVWSTIGSSNLDFLSSFRNQEVNAGILGRRIGGLMDDQFIADRDRSRSISLALWKARPLRWRLLELVFRWLTRRY